MNNRQRASLNLAGGEAQALILLFVGAALWAFLTYGVPYLKSLAQSVRIEESYATVTPRAVPHARGPRRAVDPNQWKTELPPDQ